MDKQNEKKPLLLNVQTPAVSSRQRSSIVTSTNRILRVLGLRDNQEASLVLCLCLSGGLANIVFVMGRNLGPALYVKKVGAKKLTRAMFISGLTILFATPRFAAFAKKRSATSVNSGLLLRASIILILLYIALRFHLSVYLLLYVCEDLTTLLIVMQNAAVAQELFTATEARRVLGLVQLGSTCGAIVAGITVGPIARLVGVNGIILAQIAVLMLSLLPNAATAKRAQQKNTTLPESSSIRRTLNSENTQILNTHQSHDTPQKWYREPLILILGAYTALVIVVKTTVEFEYNVIVSQCSSAVQMVSLTGRLYATAGVFAFFLNVGGSRILLSRFGLAAAAYAFPGGLVVAACALLFDHASLRSVFAARVLDLTTRWSLNDHFKSVVWIAVDRAMARAARPHIEATTKKAAAAVSALILGLAVNYGKARVTQLNWLVLAGCLALFIIGSLLRRLYVAEMTKKIDQRRVPLSRPQALLGYLTADSHGGHNHNTHTDHSSIDPLPSFKGENQHFEHFEQPVSKDDLLFCGDEDCGTQWAVVGNDDAFSAAEGRQRITARLFSRFSLGGPSVRLYLLRQIGSSPLLGDTDLESLFQGFDQWEPAIQISALRDVISKRKNIFAPLIEHSHPKNIMSFWEERLLESVGTSQKYHPAVIAAAAMTAAQRGISEAEPWLERLLIAREPAPRCAAAVALLILGWGIGGPLTLASAEVLQEALSYGIIISKKKPRLVRVTDGTSLRRFSLPINFNTEDQSIQELESQERAAQTDWVNAIERGQEGLALISAARLTSLRVARRNYLENQKSVESALTDDEEEVINQNIPNQKESLDESSQVLSALRSLQCFSNKLTIDTGTWLELCTHPNSAVRSAVLDLPLPLVIRPHRRKQLLNRIADECGGRETAVAAAGALSRLVEQNSRLRPLVFDALLSRLERASCAFENSSDHDAYDVVCLLDALRAVTRPNDARRVSEAVHTMSAKATDENEGFLLDFVFELLDENKACPSNLENAVEQRARDVRQARDAMRFVMRIKKFVTKMDYNNIAKTATLLKGFEIDPQDVDAMQVAAELSQLASAYLAERLYGARQQLLARCILIGRARASDGCSVRARDAWKSLRSRDPRLASAVMELLDDVLPANLKSLVLPLLDPSADSNTNSSASMKTVTEFLKSDNNRLGVNLANALSLYVGLGVDNGMADKNNSLAAVNLLRRTRLFGGSLVGQHLQPLAEACEWRTITCHGESICRPGETYLIARGSCILHRNGISDQRLEQGAIVQEYHALGRVASWSLPLARATAVITNQHLLLLVVDAKQLAKLMRSVSPKFSFGLLKSLVNTLPKPSQLGGRSLSVQQQSSDNFSTRQEIKSSRPIIPDKSNDHRCCSTFTPLEIFLVLRDAKMLRFVPDAYLTTLADVAQVLVFEPNQIIAKISNPTDSTLYVLADGLVELRWRRDVSVCLDQPGASFGNTALLSDTSWPYSVCAGPKGASVFALRRYRVHDALRGRRDLAAAVAEGFLKTLGRRALQHISIEEGLQTVDAVVSQGKHTIPSSPLGISSPATSDTSRKNTVPPSVTTALRVDFVTTISSTPPDHRINGSSGFAPLHRARSFELLSGLGAVSPATRHLLQHHSSFSTSSTRLSKSSAFFKCC